jgi:hypothetical protein
MRDFHMLHQAKWGHFLANWCIMLKTMTSMETNDVRFRVLGLDIEIIHRPSPSGDAEQILINLQATPSFEAFGRLAETANPFAFWAKAMQMAWLPWLAAADAMLPRNRPLQLVGLEAMTHSADCPTRTS